MFSRTAPETYTGASLCSRQRSTVVQVFPLLGAIQTDTGRRPPDGGYTRSGGFFSHDAEPGVYKSKATCCARPNTTRVQGIHSDGDVMRRPFVGMADGGNSRGSAQFPLYFSKNLPGFAVYNPVYFEFNRHANSQIAGRATPPERTWVKKACDDGGLHGRTEPRGDGLLGRKFGPLVVQPPRSDSAWRPHLTRRIPAGLVRPARPSGYSGLIEGSRTPSDGGLRASAREPEVRRRAPNAAHWGVPGAPCAGLREAEVPVMWARGCAKSPGAYRCRTVGVYGCRSGLCARVRGCALNARLGC